MNFRNFVLIVFCSVLLFGCSDARVHSSNSTNRFVYFTVDIANPLDKLITYRIHIIQGARFNTPSEEYKHLSESLQPLGYIVKESTNQDIAISAIQSDRRPSVDIDQLIGTYAHAIPVRADGDETAFSGYWKIKSWDNSDSMQAVMEATIPSDEGVIDATLYLMHEGGEQYVSVRVDRKHKQGASVIETFEVFKKDGNTQVRRLGWWSAIMRCGNTPSPEHPDLWGKYIQPLVPDMDKRFASYFESAEIMQVLSGRSQSQTNVNSASTDSKESKPCG